MHLGSTMLRYANITPFTPRQPRSHRVTLKVLAEAVLRVNSFGFDGPDL